MFAAFRGEAVASGAQVSGTEFAPGRWAGAPRAAAAVANSQQVQAGSYTPLAVVVGATRAWVGSCCCPRRRGSTLPAVGSRSDRLARAQLWAGTLNSKTSQGVLNVPSSLSSSNFILRKKDICAY